MSSVRALLVYHVPSNAKQQPVGKPRNDGRFVRNVSPAFQTSEASDKMYSTINRTGLFPETFTVEDSRYPRGCNEFDRQLRLEEKRRGYFYQSCAEEYEKQRLIRGLLQLEGKKCNEGGDAGGEEDEEVAAGENSVVSGGTSRATRQRKTPVPLMPSVFTPIRQRGQRPEVIDIDDTLHEDREAYMKRASSAPTQKPSVMQNSSLPSFQHLAHEHAGSRLTVTPLGRRTPSSATSEFSTAMPNPSSTPFKARSQASSIVASFGMSASGTYEGQGTPAKPAVRSISASSGLLPRFPGHPSSKTPASRSPVLLSGHQGTHSAVVSPLLMTYSTLSASSFGGVSGTASTPWRGTMNSANGALLQNARAGSVSPTGKSNQGVLLNSLDPSLGRQARQSPAMAAPLNQVLTSGAEAPVLHTMPMLSVKTRTTNGEVFRSFADQNKVEAITNILTASGSAVTLNASADDHPKHLQASVTRRDENICDNGSYCEVQPTSNHHRKGEERLCDERLASLARVCNMQRMY